MNERLELKDVGSLFQVIGPEMAKLC